MFQGNVVENIETHILCSKTGFRKSFRLWFNVEKHSRTRKSTDDNMVHVRSMLDK